MKKKFLLLLGCTTVLYTANAQLSEDGFPQTLVLQNQDIPVNKFDLPALTIEDIQTLVENKEFNAPFMVAKLFGTTISFPESGTLIRTDDGNYVWKISVNIPNAKGIGVYFDKFQLPKGVSMYIHNSNTKHVLGAYTHNNNAEDFVFSTEAVEGNTAFIELNIDAAVNVDDIQLHINNLAAYFRSVDHLSTFADGAAGMTTIDMYDDAVFGGASVCMVNAICPQGNGFEIPRAASLQTLYVIGGGIGMCSAAMVNTANNVVGSCKQYVLTASHCEGTGSRSDAAFNNTLFRFEYEHPTCEWTTTVPNAKTITGGKFVARSDYSSGMSPGSIKGDFLLLEMRSRIPTAWNVPLNGWVKTPPHLSYGVTGKFIGFHHPSGDIKSLSTSKTITSSSVGASGTHWQTFMNEGYVAQGSSGSSLFNNDGKIIGIASVAGTASPIPAACYTDRRGAETTNIMNSISYSKISYVWDNPGDIGGDNKKLGPWLDPTGSGVNTVESVKSDCNPLSAGASFIEAFDVNFIVYPNPSKDGRFQMNVKLNDATDLKFEVVDITGRTLMTEKLPYLLDQIIDVNLSALSSGIYLIKLSNAYGSTSNKVVIEK